MNDYKTKAADWKKKTVQEFVKLLKDYPIVGSVNMENLPAKQLQRMRDLMRDTAVIKMAKRRLISIAIEDVKGEKKGIEELEKDLRGMPALLFTKQNPFTLYKMLSKNKSPMPAKAGQTAPKDIVIPAGPTNFSPGPIIGELGSFKIKTSIENGKVAIKQDSVVAKEGDIISPKLAEILGRLGIEPMEMGLDLVAVYEDGSILKKDILAVDEEEYLDNVRRLASEAFNLAMFAGYPTAETTQPLITKAHREAMSLSIEGSIPTRETLPNLLAKAEAQMLGLKGKTE